MRMIVTLVIGILMVAITVAILIKTISPIFEMSERTLETIESEINETIKCSISTPTPAPKVIFEDDFNDGPEDG
ncbi:hypothetical protein [Thermococcus piezophilus]|uniref:hypothetical protein n=1 Tax=Thermococcus piezophilus TaxID=1712654 RepID=UPI000AE7974B|nr:hypothetical protein [Thermococcus piezophilus]